MSTARETFTEFHQRNPMAVYPFDGEDSDTFEFDAVLPYMVEVGRAVRVLYDSDKWNEVGDVIGYYHDHGKDDGAHVFEPSNQVKLYAPQAYLPNKKRAKFPVRWSSEVVLLGTCEGWYAQEAGAKELVHGKVTDSILVCSPFGYVSKKDKKRAYLAVVDVDSGIVECIIHGPSLRVTAAGITG